MPSPFPGMDPYMEMERFYRNLASEIQGRLNRALGARYYAALEAYVTYESVEASAPRRTSPDVSVWRDKSKEGERPAAAAIVSAPAESMVALDESYSSSRSKCEGPPIACW